MQYRQLGNSGVRVSVIGMGTNQFGGNVDQKGVNAIISEAIELGINFIDTADVYQKGKSEKARASAAVHPDVTKRRDSRSGARNSCASALIARSYNSAARFGEARRAC